MASSSITTTPADKLGPISLALFKLSFCTTLTPRSPMTWTHLPNRDGMFAVFDQVTKKNPGGMVVEKTLLKCVRGGELIEEIDLDVLQQQVRTDEARAESQQLRDEYRIVIILLKNPFLALRYQLPDGQIRKIQMNFLPASGCDIAVNIFRSIGIPIRDKSQPVQPQTAAPRPHSAQGALFSSSQLRPHDQTNVFVTACDQTPPAPQSSQFSSRPTSARPNSQSGSQERLCPLNNASYGSLSQSTKLSQILSGPASASNGVNQEESSRPINFIPDPRSNLERSDSTHVAGYNTLARPNSSSAVFGPGMHPALRPPLTSRLLPSPELGTQSSPFGHEARPSSAPQTQTWAERLFTDDIPLSQMLPPKRMLPFPELKEKPLNQDDEEVAVEQEKLEPITNNKAKPMAMKQTKGRATKAKAKSSARKASLPTPELSSSAPKPRSRKTAVAKEDSDKASPSSAPPRVIFTRKASSREVSPISETTYPSCPPVAKASKKRLLTPLEDTKTNKRKAQVSEGPSPPTTEQQKGPLDAAFSIIKPAEFLDSLDGWIQKYNHLPAPEPPKTSKDHLAKYAKQSDEERAKAIDKLICDCIQDENFVKLVEDVDVAWRRIGLGF